MSRLKDTLIGQRAYGLHQQQPMVDLKNGGQNGPMVDFSSYVSNAAYVRRNLIPILVEAPRGFQDLDNSDAYISALKALIELHAQSVEGLTSTLTLDTIETAVGGAGEMQEDPSDMKRARSTPTFVWKEKYGLPVTTLLQNWMTGLIMDPITKYPTVIADGLRKPQDLLPDYYGCTVCFIEPDPTHTHVMRAWLCTNMYPKTSGEITGRRDLTQAGDGQEYSVEFTALTQVGAGVNAFAQQILNTMQLGGMNPNTQAAFVQAFDPDVTAQNVGYGNMLSDEVGNRGVL